MFMEPTKVIFLDVDGVLNSMTFAKRMLNEHGVRVFNEDILDPVCIRRLKRIVEKTDAAIVVSSSWRMLPTTMANLISQLNILGMKVFDTTPILHKERGYEIQAWLDQHPTVSKFVILDDDNDMNSLQSHLVQTVFEDGIQPDHVDMAIKYLTEGVA